MSVGSTKLTAKPSAIFLMGPTASGKTDIAIGLRAHLPVDIISVDSALVYRGLDIGSAKPSDDELTQAPHRLIDICDPAESYSAAQFVSDAKQAMEEITQQGRIPLLVGGTMLYFKALLEGLADAPSTSIEIREAISHQANQLGWPAMHQQLAEVDPETAAQLHPNHSQRIQRALEVYQTTGIPLSQYHALHQQGGGSEPITARYQITQLALLPRNRMLLHQRIEQRFHSMLAAGFEAEVRALYDRGDLHSELPAIRAVGYRQMWNYLSEQSQLTSDAPSRSGQNYEAMVEKGIIATRQLAKRQLTWLKKWPDLNRIWIDDEDGNWNERQKTLTNCLKIVC